MLVLDTKDVPAGQRREAFHAVAAGESGSCSIDHEPPESHVWKRLEVWRLGAISLFATHGTGVTVRRSPRQARRDSLDTISVITQSQGTARYLWNGHERALGPGGLVLAHRAAGYEYGSAGQGLSVAFMADTDLLGLPEPLIQAAIPLTASSPVAPLLLHHLRGLYRAADHLATTPAAEALGQTALDLTRALVASVSASAVRREVAAETLLTRILAHVRAHLTDPGLTPERIAATHNISVRALYRLCENGGLSLEKWIIRQRLEAVRTDLASPAHAHRTIEAIARSRGFANASYFSRRFRTAYGETPGSYRRRASR